MAQLRENLTAVRARLMRDPAILEWDSRVPLNALLGGAVVTSCPADCTASLPYLDQTFDMVVIGAGGGHRLEEARRVATAAVIEIDLTRQPDAENDPVTLLWQPHVLRAAPLPVTSIIIPVHDGLDHTDACLATVMATLPGNFRGEILVVDDASTDGTAEMLLRWQTRSDRVRVLRNAHNIGFLRSCNLAGSESNGDVLIFLNNDALPEPGWLPPLLRLVSEWPDSTIAGGKLIFPNGRLQEAGGIIFADGSGCNFGRGDPVPDRPLYSFMRDVDYCSGALLAVGRALFLELGGFDEVFAPAYYEDTDLCFRVRARGGRVLYQPRSVAVHVEGGSAGTDLDRGMKRYQTLNQTKFVAKWRDALERQPPPLVELSASALQTLAVPAGRRRALVCAPRMPEFDCEGGSRRVFHLVEMLKHAGWAISFVAHNHGDGGRYARVLEDMGVQTYAGPDSVWAGSEYLEDLDGLLSNGGFDLALVAFWELAEQLMPRLRTFTPQTRVIIDSVDLHFLRLARKTLSPSIDRMTPMLDGDFGSQMVREMNAYISADAVLAVSQKEADLINDFAGTKDLAFCVPDTEAIELSPVSFAQRKGLLFLGNFRHSPNVEALKYLCADIIPRLPTAVLQQHPLFVVGTDLEKVMRGVIDRHPNVRFVGWVPSVIPYLENARATLVPLLHGAGTKRKLLQSLMAGTAAVSTHVGIEGLGLEHERHVLIADSPQDFALAIERVVEDQALWERLAWHGRDHVARQHDRELVSRRFTAVVDAVMAAPFRHS